MAVSPARKLKSKWSGPFIVKEVSPFGAIEIQIPTSGNTFKVNGQRLKEYFGGEIERGKSIVTLNDPP